MYNIKLKVVKNFENDKELLDINDIYQILNIKKNCALRIVHRDLSYLKIGNRIRVRRKDLDEYIEAKILSEKTNNK